MWEPPADDAKPKTPLARILHEHPEARGRISQAVVALSTALLLALAALGVLLIWHLRRRAALIRSRLGTARGGPLPDSSELRPFTEPTDEERPE